MVNIDLKLKTYEQLQNEIITLNTNNYLKDLKIKCLQQRIDKAVEVIDLITPELWNISNKMTYRLKDIKYILKGDDTNES